MIKFDLNPSTPHLRQFGFAALFGFSLMAVMLLWKHSDWQFNGVVYTLFGLALVCPILAVVAPRANRPIYILLLLVAIPIGFVVSAVVLRLIYYLLFTPVALWFRLRGRDAMAREWDPAAKTYWRDHRDQTRPRVPSSYLRLY